MIKIKKLSQHGILWLLVILILIQIVSLIAAMVDALMTIDAVSAATYAIFMIPWIIGLIGLYKKYLWSFYILLGIPIVTVGAAFQVFFVPELLSVQETIIPVDPLTEVIASAFLQLLTIIVTLWVYKKFPKKISKRAWYIFIFILVLVILGLNMLSYSFYTNLTTTYQTNYTVKGNHYWYTGFRVILEDTLVDVRFHSTDIINLYLLNSPEFEKYVSNQSSTAYDIAEDITDYEYNIKLPRGIWYLLIISPSNVTVNTSLELSCNFCRFPPISVKNIN